ncbi:MAG: rod-binding protein [Treponema sp.]|nr:rod-binding protein [Treponema sp.]
MEISGFGLINMDDYRLSSQSTANNPEKFADALKRASAANAPVQARPGQEPIDKEDKLYQLCLELETFLVKNLLTSMRNTVQKSGLVDEGFAGKMYEDMLYDEYAKDFTKNANFGLAEQAYRQMKNY